MLGVFSPDADAKSGFPRDLGRMSSRKMRLLDLIRRQKVTVEVGGDILVVTMPGTGFSITYEKTEENRLVASSFHARTRPNETRKVTFPKFLSLAWTAANEKARELGWI